MADKKKINSAEIMSDEELDKVAGGNLNEMVSDLAFFREMGFWSGVLPGEKSQTTSSSSDVGRVICLEEEFNVAWSKAGIATVCSERGLNEYYDPKGNQISRAEALKFAAKKLNSKVNYLNYMV